MIKKINNKIVSASGKNIMTVIVKVGGKKLWKKYLIEDKKVPKVAKNNLQGMLNDLL